MTKNNLFILAGNGPYSNRGCEAIVRGTVNILRLYFDSPQFLTYTLFRSRENVEAQRKGETDPAIRHEVVRSTWKRFDMNWFAINTIKRVLPSGLKHYMYANLKPELPLASAVLAIGGDNYSLDYRRRPVVYTALDDLVVSRGKPMVIWGASVGPFSKDPGYEKYMALHLRKVTIFARESLTREYLNGLGLVENVHQVADPAFVMEAKEPAPDKLGIPMKTGAIGINLSPLLARFSTGGDLGQWISRAAQIVQAIAASTDRPIYLIPHVIGIDTKHDDHGFMSKVAAALTPGKADVHMVPNTLNAEELKWVISKMALFAGARTHSTIASLSSCVPTLSFGYSVKSRGINRDVYGHSDYCIQADEMSPDRVTERVEAMVSNMAAIAESLRVRIPHMNENALRAGEILAQILGGHSDRPALADGETAGG